MLSILYSLSYCKSKIVRWFALFNYSPVRGLSGGASPPQINLSLHESVPGIILGVVFVFGAVVSDALDKHFGIVAAGQSALGGGPGVLGFLFIMFAARVFGDCYCVPHHKKHTTRRAPRPGKKKGRGGRGGEKGAPRHYNGDEREAASDGAGESLLQYAYGVFPRRSSRLAKSRSCEE